MDTTSNSQEKTNRRHEENLELIKMRASEMSSRSEGCAVTGLPVSDSVVLEWNGPPSCQPYPRLKLCSLCHVLIPNDLHLIAHVKSQKHLTSVKDTTDCKFPIVEATETQTARNGVAPVELEKGKSGNKKRRQKLRQKMQMKCREYEDQKKENFENCLLDSPQKSRLHKILAELKSRLDANGIDKIWLPADIHFLERCFGELNRIMSADAENTQKQQRSFWSFGGPDAVLKLLTASERDKGQLIVPLRSITNAAKVLKASLIGNGKTSLEIIYSNRLSIVIDILAHHMKALSTSEEVLDSCSTNLVVLLTEVVITSLSCILESGKEWSFWSRVPEGKDGFRVRISLLASYIVVSGYADSFIWVIRKWTKWTVGLNEKQEKLILAAVQLLQIFLRCFLSYDGHGDPFSRTVLSVDNGGLLVGAVEDSRLCGLLSLLYVELINPDQTGERFSGSEISDPSLKLSEAVLRLLNSLAALSRSSVKAILCCEYTSLEFRHIISRLLAHASQLEQSHLLHESIVAIGHFVCENVDNQTLVQAGSQPSILRQLCVFPFCYFSDPKLTRVLFPTLIACTYQHDSNREILEQELSGILLAAYLEDEIQAEEARKSKQKVPKITEDFFDMNLRFPRVSWSGALAYFQSPLNESE